MLFACKIPLPRSKVFYASTLLILLLVSILFVTDYIDDQQLAYAGPQPTDPPKGQIYIVIKLNQRILELYSDGQLYKKYRVAVGKRASPSPTGEWVVACKDYSDKEILGTRWLGLDVPWGSYGIHGTNRPWSIGQFASKGCIRMRNKDIEELFEWVPIHTPIHIEGPKAKVVRTLRYPTSGPEVVTLQLKLKQLGLYQGRADGLFGTTTQEAVKAFQHNKNMEASGIVDATLASILKI